MSEKKDIVFCTGGGCTAKLGAGVLSRILEKLPRGEKDPNLLVGYDSRGMAFFFPLPPLFPTPALPNPPAFRPFPFMPVCLCPAILPTAGRLVSFARLAAAGFAVWLP